MVNTAPLFHRQNQAVASQGNNTNFRSEFMDEAANRYNIAETESLHT